MPVGRLFSDLTVFDVLGNFVPGVVVLTTVVSILPADRAAMVATAPPGGLVVLGFVSYALGHLVQRYAARASGTRETFERSILLVQSDTRRLSARPKSHRRCPRVLLLPYHAWRVFVGDRVRSHWRASLLGDLAALPTRAYQSFLGAVLHVRLERDRPLSDLRLPAKAWKIARKRFGLTREYRSYGDLLHLLSSDLERDGPSRALRFQAIRNFHRGMWIACFIAAGLYLAVIVGHHVPASVAGGLAGAGIEPWRPVIQEQWPPLWSLSSLLFLASYCFWELAETFEQAFVEYLLTDFVTCHADEYL